MKGMNFWHESSSGLWGETGGEERETEAEASETNRRGRLLPAHRPTAIETPPRFVKPQSHVYILGCVYSELIAKHFGSIMEDEPCRASRAHLDQCNTERHAGNAPAERSNPP